MSTEALALGCAWLVHRVTDPSWKADRLVNTNGSVRQRGTFYLSTQSRGVTYQDRVYYYCTIRHTCGTSHVGKDHSTLVQL